MKKKRGKTVRAKGRLPIEAVLRLRSHPISTKKGEKGYNKKKMNKQTRKITEENICEDNY